MLSSAAPLSDVPAGSTALRTLFVLLSVVVASLFPVAVWRSGAPRALRQAAIATVVVAAWLAITLGAAASGALRFSPPPPTMMALFVAVFAIAVGVSLSPVGRRIATQLPLAALVGYQGFRVGVELLMHRAYTEGLMPVQMSYSGRNLDIITGLTAIGVAAWLVAGGKSLRVVLVWNTLGLALLINILAVAILSAPTPFRVFMNEPSNIWVSQAPWVWLPAVLVLEALMGHMLVYRRLWIESRTARAKHPGARLEGLAEVRR